MKKLLMILMMVFAVGCGAFAKPLSFDAGEYKILTNDENEQYLFFTRYSDSQIVKLIKAAAPEEIDGRRLVFKCYFINDKVTWIAEKYYNYYLIKKDNTEMMFCHNLGDGREIVVVYKLELKDDN